MRERVQGIYKIENNINGKCYIGQSIDVYSRWKGHTKIDKRLVNYPLYRAFKKYGIKNFKFKILEHVDDVDNLTLRELFWYYKLKPEYNQMLPTEPITSYKKRQIYQIDMETLEIIKEYDSLTDASIETNTGTSKISLCCNNLRASTGGYYWCFIESYDETWLPKTNNTIKKVYLIDKETNECIKEFRSIKQASDETGVCKTNISRFCNNKRTPTNKYRWSFEKGNDD
jgi:group I intron endonuclease